MSWLLEVIAGVDDAVEEVVEDSRETVRSVEMVLEVGTLILETWTKAEPNELKLVGLLSEFSGNGNVVEDEFACHVELPPDDEEADIAPEALAVYKAATGLVLKESVSV